MKRAENYILNELELFRFVWIPFTREIVINKKI